MGLAQRTTGAASIEAGPEEVLDRTAALVPWLSEQAARIEETRRIPADVAERLFETGLFNLMRPQRFGGLGASPDTRGKRLLTSHRAVRPPPGSRG